MARWQLMIDNNSADNLAVVYLDVNDATTGTVLASRIVRRREWSTTWQYQEFALPFTLESSRAGHALEERVYWYGTAYVRGQQVRVTRMSGGVTESYVYDADGERVANTVNGVTTVYFGGLWEQVVGGASRRYYTFNGQVVAMRDSATNAVTYLHGDHLGSVSVATTSSGATLSKQEYDPWGKLRAGGIGATSLNYTGQRLDGTGLPYYHARSYDPALARFVSADSVVPGSASGGMDGVALKGLTVDFHEPGFAGQIAGENGQPFPFQMSVREGMGVRACPSPGPRHHAALRCGPLPFDQRRPTLPQVRIAAIPQ